MKHRNYPDNYGYMLETSRPYGHQDNGRGDAIGRTVRAAIIYREQRFIDAIFFSFPLFFLDGTWKPRRHPEDPRTEDFSRDHTIWFIIWLCYFRPTKVFTALSIPYQISDKFKMSLDMRLWIRALQGKWKDRFLYWIAAGLMLRFASSWNRLLLTLAGIHSQDWQDFKCTPNEELNKRELFARKNSVPSYTFDTQAWMLRCLEGWFKRRLQKRVLRCVERTNWHVRKLCDDTFSGDEKKEMANYIGMDAERAGRRLDKTTNIEMNALEGPQPEYNMDYDLLYAEI